MGFDYQSSCVASTSAYFFSLDFLSNEPIIIPKDPTVNTKKNTVNTSIIVL